MVHVCPEIFCINISLNTVRNEFAKVMFSQACVCPQGGLPGPRGCMVLVCLVWGVSGPGGVVQGVSGPGVGWYPSMH